MGHHFKEGDIISATQTVYAPDPDCLPFLKWELLTVKKLLPYPYLDAENGHGVCGSVDSTRFILAEKYVYSDWYLREFTSQMAEKVLRGKEYGSFIVRGNSRKPEEIVISARFQNVFHYSFQRHGDGILYSQVPYKTVEDFIGVCRNNTILEGKLTHWIKKSDVPLPEVRKCILIMQGLNLRIVSGNKGVATENFDPDPSWSWCLPLKSGIIVQVVKATRDPQWYVARDESYLNQPIEGLVPASLIECYIPEWFHGIMDRAKAEQLLMKTCRDGTFLVRERPSSPGRFALSVWCPDGVMHISIQFQNGKLSTGENPELPSFDSFLELVNYYLEQGMFWTKNGECVRIIFPLSRKECEIPDEIQQMDLQSIDTYLSALKEGKQRVMDIRLMLVGHFGAGKTTLSERLMGKPYKQVESTNGIDIHVRQCQFSVKDGTWKYDQGSRGVDDVHAIRLSWLLEDKEIDFSNPDVLKLIPDTSSQNVGGDEIMDQNSIKTKQISPDLDKTGPNWNSQNNENSKENTSANDFEDSFQEDRQPRLDDLGRRKSYDIELDEGVARYKFSEGTLKAISSAFGKKKSSLGSYKDKLGFISLWDFAGQFIFYSTHQVFLAPRALYLLVLDLSRSIEDFIVDEDFPVSSVDMQGKSAKEFGHFWLRSIHTFCNDQPGEPAVILVGTNKDRINCEPSERDKYIEQYFDTFREFVGDSPVALHIQPEQFAINNTANTDEDLEKLKRFIIQVARRQNHWNQAIPAKWLPLERSLNKIRSTTPIVTLDQMMKLDKKNEVSLSTREEMSLFLRYQHAVGSLIYYDDEGLSDCAILDPQWIVNAFRCLITATRFCKQRVNLRKDWQELQRHAKLHDRLIEEIWKEDSDQNFLQYKEKLLHFMEKLDIIAKPSIFVDEEKTVLDVDFFFVPSLLQNSGINSLPAVFQNESISSSKLCYMFDEGFVPPALFHRILAGCLSEYEVLQIGGKVILYCDVGAFKLDIKHYFLVTFTESVIKLQVFNLVGGDVEASLCDKLRRFLTSLLKKELGRYKQNARFSIRIHCGKTQNESSVKLLKCTELLKHGRLPCFAHDEPHIVDADEVLKYWYPDSIDPPGGKTDRHTWLDRYPSKIRERMVTDKDLSKVAQSLGRNWEFVPLDLGLPQTAIDQCKMDHYHETAMQIFDSLITWKRRSGPEATIQALVNAIQANPAVTVEWEMIKNIVDNI